MKTVIERLSCCNRTNYKYTFSCVIAVNYNALSYYIKWRYLVFQFTRELNAIHMPITLLHAKHNTQIQWNSLLPPVLLI